jgi:hypothetical protein
MWIKTPFYDMCDKTISNYEWEGLGGEDYLYLYFYCDDGSKYRMGHHQECCESVSIEDINGSLEDLLGSPLLIAEERCGDDPNDECGLYTFYALATIRGRVDIRWHGTSNGYYSVDVDFRKYKAEKEQENV